MEAYKTNKIRGRIVEMFGTIAKFSAAAGISPDVVSLKLSNKTRMTREDIELWSEVLAIDFTDLQAYFFAHNDVKSR